MTVITGKPTKLHLKHDQSWKKALETKDGAISFLKIAMPSDIQSKYDFDTIESDKNDFIDQTLHDYYSDFIFTVKDHESGHLAYIILEVQTRKCKKMAYRIINYKTLLLNRHLRESKDSKFPIILMLVVNCGKNKYDIEPIYSLYQDPTHAKDVDRIFLSHMSEMSDEALFISGNMGPICYMMKHIHKKNIMPFLLKAIELGARIWPQNQKGLYLREIICYTYFKIDQKEDEQIIKNRIETLFNQKEIGEDFMGGLARTYWNEGKEQGAYSKAIVVAEKLLSRNIEINIISDSTGLPESKILELKNSNPS